MLRYCYFNFDFGTSLAEKGIGLALREAIGGSVVLNVELTDFMWFRFWYRLIKSSSYSSEYAKAHNELAGPIFATLRRGNTERMSQRW